ncbi:MAG: hypothetical protein ACYCUM_12915 [Solirubrobacteraceae bacterium]
MQLGEELMLGGPRGALIGRGKGRAAMRALAGLAAAAATLAGASPALASRTLHVTDSAHLHPIGGGAALNETGKATGTLPGTVRVTLTIHQYTANSHFTIEAKGGSISGSGTGKLKTGKGGYASFGGALTVTGGTGTYRKARGKGGLYGTINRRTDAMTVTVRGQLQL